VNKDLKTHCNTATQDHKLFTDLQHLQAILGKVIQLVTKFSAWTAMGAGIHSNQKLPTQNS